MGGYVSRKESCCPKLAVCRALKWAGEREVGREIKSIAFLTRNGDYYGSRVGRH